MDWSTIWVGPISCMIGLAVSPCNVSPGASSQAAALIVDRICRTEPATRRYRVADFNERIYPHRVTVLCDGDVIPDGIITATD